MDFLGLGLGFSLGLPFGVPGFLNSLLSSASCTFFLSSESLRVLLGLPEVDDAEIFLSMDFERPDVEEAEFFLSRGLVMPEEDEDVSKLPSFDFKV